MLPLCNVVQCHIVMEQAIMKQKRLPYPAILYFSNGHAACFALKHSESIEEAWPGIKCTTQEQYI